MSLGIFVARDERADESTDEGEWYATLEERLRYGNAVARRVHVRRCGIVNVTQLQEAACWG